MYNLQEIKPIYMKDYKLPLFAINNIKLDFDFNEDKPPLKDNFGISSSFFFDFGSVSNNLKPVL